MENGKYSTDNYIIHCTLSDKTLILFTDKRLLAVKKSLISHNWETDWSEEWTNIAKVDTSGDGMKIRITTKVGVSSELLSLPFFDNSFYGFLAYYRIN